MRPVRNVARDAAVRRDTCRVSPVGVGAHEKAPERGVRDPAIENTRLSNKRKVRACSGVFG